MFKVGAYFFFVFMLSQNLFAQIYDANVLSNKFNNYLKNNFQEKIYVHTDKEIYLAGEIIWFKVYNVEAYTNLPINLSKVVYLEVLDSENKPVLQNKIALKEDGGHGFINVPTNLNSGNYTLRCYTNWMKNFDSAYFFHKQITVYNTLKEEVLPGKQPLSKKYNIQFFPEGGNLIADLSNKIAFKATDHTGESYLFNAAILDMNSDTVSKFKSSELGIGSFNFIPKIGQNYKVVINPFKGNQFTETLPVIFEKGVVLNVNNLNSDELGVVIQNNLGHNSKFNLVIHSGPKIVFSKEIETNKTIEEIKIPLQTLNDGISHFTLFNNLGNPICERLYFKRPASLLDIKVKSEKDNFKPKELVKLNINQSFKNLPVAANYSIAVYQTDTTINQNDIEANFWFTSELKGKIENANWYFKDAPLADLDNLMLTHGWRRFKWENVLNSTNNDAYQYPLEIEGHIINGTILNSINSKPLFDKQLYLSVPGRNFDFYTSISNQNGAFSFYTRNFYKGNEIIVQPASLTDSLASISVNSPFSTNFFKSELKDFNPRLNQNYLLKRSVASQVNAAYLSKFLQADLSISNDSSHFFKKAGKVYKLIDYTRFNTMEEVLREYVPEVNVTIRQKNYYLSVFDEKVQDFYADAPLILLDGVPMLDAGNSIMKIDPLKVERFEIMLNTYLYGRGVFKGIVNFKTHKGDLANYTLPKSALVLDYPNLQTPIEFYSPMYDGDSTNLSRIPDYRTTLYWNPNLKTDKNGNTEVNFYTSNFEGKYIIDIQSITKDGLMGSQKSIIYVNNDKQKIN